MGPKEIEKFAEDTLKRYDLYRIPVDPVTLANKAGIRVSNALFSDDTLSGLISKRGHNISILVNQSDHPFRKRFTIAHELGHHFLHLTETTDVDIVEKVDLFRATIPVEGAAISSRTNEIQANQFAAALLMPKTLLQEAYTNAKEVFSLARLFNVSEEAMSYRLHGLGLE